MSFDEKDRTIDALEDAVRLRRERDQARETAARLNRRCQEAESALCEWRKIRELAGEMKGGSLGRKLLAYGIKLADDENERLRDLVRYERGDLHLEGLISNEEYAELCEIDGSPQRLEGYDAMRNRLQKARELLVSLREDIAPYGWSGPRLRRIDAFLDDLPTWGESENETMPTSN